LRIAALIDNVIDLAAESVQRRNCLPPLRGQEKKAVVKAGAALRCFLLAILFRRHDRFLDNAAARRTEC
jgi:hypothetical protein